MKNHVMRFVLAGALAFGFTLPLCGVARADYGDECHRRLEKARAKIDHDSAKYGPNSPRVDHDVANLEDQRAWCRNHHADWDHSIFDVGIYVHK